VSYEVFESLERDGRPLRVDELAAPSTTIETRILGTCADWGAALHVVARLEAEKRRTPRGATAFAFGIRSTPPS